MRVYTIIRKQRLNISIPEAWDFLSSPKNLADITPAYMRFQILHLSGGEKMFPGQIIRYKLYVLPFIPFYWTTEITHVNEPHYFVDEQRFGPYALWHHQHHLRKLDDGVEMIDEINYAIPFGILGRFCNWLFVRRQLNAIFDFRFKTLDSMFNQKRILKSA